MKVKILIEINIIKLEEIDILISRSSALIFNYKIEIFVELKLKRRAIRQSIYTRKTIDILSYSQVLILIYFIESLSNLRDFLFELEEKSYLLLYAYLVDSFLLIILIRNNSNLAIKISRNYRIRIIVEADFNLCYHAFVENVVNLIAR